MPPLRKLKVGALDELARQLRFAPPETLRRQLERAEQLSAEIDPAVNYPEDWVIFRVTGYRPQMESPAIVVGEALIGDMSVLVERLSAAARISEDEIDASGFVDSATLQARWGVSRKTLERYRARGLIARRVAARRGVSRLAFPRESVERFESTWKSRLEEARTFSRIDAVTRARILRRARAYQQLGCSLNQAAERIAPRYNRALESVRRVLQGSGIDFGAPGPPSARERRFIERAWWWGIEPGRIARRLSRPSASIHRIIVDARAARLRTIAFPQESGIRPGLLERALASPECICLGAPVPGDLLEVLHDARRAEPPEPGPERTRLTGYHGLIARSAASVATLKKHGNAAAVVDRIETDLRWAARIKAELIRSQLPLIIRTLESSGPLEEVRAPVLIGLLRQAVAAAADAIDSYHAGKGGRLAAPVGLAVTRISTRAARETGASSPRARALLGTGVHFADWSRAVCAWQTHKGDLWLEPHAAVRAGLGVLEPRARRLLELRFGWGLPPCTVIEAAGQIGLPPVRAAAMERRALGRAGKAGAS